MDYGRAEVGFLKHAKANAHFLGLSITLQTHNRSFFCQSRRRIQSTANRTFVILEDILLFAQKLCSCSSSALLHVTRVKLSKME